MAETLHGDRASYPSILFDNRNVIKRMQQNVYLFAECENRRRNGSQKKKGKEPKEIYKEKYRPEIGNLFFCHSHMFGLEIQPNRSLNEPN